MAMASDYLDDLAGSRRYEFSTDQIAEDLGISIEAARARIRRLRNKGRVCTPLRSFHVLVNPSLYWKSPPAEYYIDSLMKHLNEPYYVGLLSAAARYGASHQAVQVLQVMVKCKRPRIVFDRSRIEFTVRHDLEKMPVEILKTGRGTVRYATPELTAFEMAGYPLVAAGQNNIATVLIELAERLDAQRLAAVAKLQPVSWVQRLGYFLEFIRQKELAEALVPDVRKRARSFTPLVRCVTNRKGEHNPKWKVLVNTEVDPDIDF